MKKHIALMLIISILAAAFAACSARKGTDSLEKLVGVTMEYIKSGGDYSRIKDAADTRARLVYFLKEGVYEMNGDFTWEDASKKADLILSGAENLQKEDPELAGMILEAASRTDESVKDLEDAIEKLCKLASYERYCSKYRDMKCEFDPDNVSVGKNGYNRYHLGSVRDVGDTYDSQLDLVYYENDGVFFFIGFEETIC